MAKKKAGLWDDIEESDFSSDENVDDADIGDFTKAGMVIYSINTNLARHLVRVTDSLKMIERRILYSMYKIGATPGHLTKSSNIVAATMTIHHHGDISIYDSMVGMTQYWKKNLPMIQGDCNFGSIITPKSYAASRYTEAELTPYAYECFFEDYNEKALTFDEHLTGVKEPVFLPTKFPNVLVNGSSGLGYGFAPCIPPYNCNDIVDICKRLIENPDDDDILIYPDLPTGCDIVDDPEEIKSICDTGVGKLRMRARIDIDGETKPNKWILRIRSIPFTVPYDVIYDNIIELGKSKKIAIEDVHECSSPYVASDGTVKSDIDLAVVISRSLDPAYVRSYLFKNAGLEKTLAVRFTVVKGYKEIVDLNLKGLVMAWLNERRLYKRSLFNHRINWLKSEINIRDIMIELLSKDNLDKTMHIIRNTNYADIPEALMKDYGMSSHQAKVVASKPTSAFAKDARDKYIAERDKFQKELDGLLDVVYSSKKIDKIILDELEDLRKYATPRKSPIIKIDGEKTISDTEHFLVTTEKGCIKKLPNPPDKQHGKSWFGSFAPSDSPKYIFAANNYDNVLMIDSTGKYTIMPVYDIPNSLYNEYGEDIYKVAKLEGSVIYQMKLQTSTAASYKSKGKRKGKEAKIDTKNLAIICLSANGYMKMSDLSEYVEGPDGKPITKIRGSRAARVREGDSLVKACLWGKDYPEKFAGVQLMIYTELGEYVMLDPSFVPEMGKVTQGNSMLTPSTGDNCAGFSVVFPEDDYVVVVTSKGLVRKEELKYFTASKKRKDKHYLCNVDNTESIIFACSAKDNHTLRVKMKSGIIDIPVSDIPVIARRAKGQKMIPIASGDKIICCELN